MSRSYKKAEVIVDPKTLIAYINQPRNEFVPSYAYYAVTDYLFKNKIKANAIVFNDDDRIYLLDELKGKYDWKEVKSNEPN